MCPAQAQPFTFELICNKYQLLPFNETCNNENTNEQLSIRNGYHDNTGSYYYSDAIKTVAIKRCLKPQ